MILSTTIMMFIALGALSLSQKKHRQRLLPGYHNISPLLTHSLRLTGFCGLCFAAATVIVVKGWSLGSVYCCAGLTVTAFAQALWLSYRPRWMFVALVLAVAVLPISLSHGL